MKKTFIMLKNLVTSFNCGVVKGDTMECRVFSSAEITSTYTLVFFFPMTSAVDQSEIRALKDKIAEFTDSGCKVLGVTSESFFSIMNWIKADPSDGGFGGNVNFDILSDRDLTFAKIMGVKQPSGLPCRASFIIDREKRIRYTAINARYIGRNIDDLLRVVQAMNTIDHKGMPLHIAIPSNWKPGKEVIDNSVEGRKEFFQNLAAEHSNAAGAGAAHEELKHAEGPTHPAN